MKNYGRKIELQHDKCDVQFVNQKKGFMRKHLIECFLIIQRKLIFFFNLLWIQTKKQAVKPSSYI